MTLKNHNVLTVFSNKKPLKTVRPDCRQFDLENRQTKVTVKVTIELVTGYLQAE